MKSWELLFYYKVKESNNEKVLRKKNIYYWGKYYKVNEEKIKEIWAAFWNTKQTKKKRKEVRAFLLQSKRRKNKGIVSFFLEF